MALGKIHLYLHLRICKIQLSPCLLMYHFPAYKGTLLRQVTLDINVAMRNSAQEESTRKYKNHAWNCKYYIVSMI